MLVIQVYILYNINKYNLKGIFTMENLETKTELTPEEQERQKELFVERLEIIAGIIDAANEEDPDNIHVVGTIKGLNLLSDFNMTEIMSILAMDMDKYENGVSMELNGMQDNRTAKISKTCYKTETNQLIYKYDIEVEIRKGDMEGIDQGVEF